MVTKTWVKGMLTRFFNKLHKVAISGDYNDLENKLVVNTTALNPTGTIINFFGLETQVPDGYLPCNGAEYLKEDYPILANHLAEIDTSFSRTDYAGSDSEHFKVPDLRGEFLRCTGTNKRANQGSGSQIGIHQDATRSPLITAYASTASYVALLWESTGATTNAPINVDSYYKTSANRYFRDIGGGAMSTSNNSSGNNYAYTLRPTNTSVLYCIKY